MLRVSRLTDYALVLLTRLAQCGDRPQTAQALAAATHLHLPMTSKSLKKLCQEGLVSSRRGQQGGYTLARKPADISIVEIVESMEGPIALAPCESGELLCDIHRSCQIRPHWHLINSRLRAELAQLSLAELCQPPRRDLPPTLVALNA